jgi:hypothetical protein
MTRLRKINQLPISKGEKDLRDTRALFVVTQKDFATLPIAISYLIQSTGIAPTKVDIVTPGKHIEECVELLRTSDISGPIVHSEESVLSSSNLEFLREAVGARFGWVYQQLLKLQMSLNSLETFTLVCDADTFILRPRKWIDGTATVLCPSFENNSEYYIFLNRAFGIASNPQHSFVSHHMLISSEKLRTIFDIFNLSSIEDLASVIYREANLDHPSMVSVDYEFYAQSMQEYFPEEIFVEKWSNIGLASKYFRVFRKSLVFRKLLSLNYQSVSFHSWS